MAKDIEPKIRSNDPHGDKSGMSFDEAMNEQDAGASQGNRAGQNVGDAGAHGGLRGKAKNLAKREATNAAIHGGLYAAEKGAFGNKLKPLAGLSREELKNYEKNSGKDAYDLTKNAKDNLTDPGWYKATGKGLAKKGAKALIRKNKNRLLVTAAVGIITAIAILLIMFIGPFKGVHFETVLRSANFARFQLLVRKHFSAVVFNGSVLTQDSVGNFRNSPLVRQIRLAVPDSQLEQLGREGKVLWEFNENSKFGDEFLPLKESLKAIVIDGQRYEIDQFARDAFGKDYKDLTTAERWTVQNNFIKEINVKMGDYMALKSRMVRWNPMTQFRQKTGIRLVKWLNAARDYAGKSAAEARELGTQETADRVMDPDSGPKSAIPDINEDAEQARQDYVNANKEGRPPGILRSKLAGQAALARNISDAVFAATAYCIGRELYSAFGSPEAQADRESQAARMAANDMTATDQIKSHDVTAPAVGYANSTWDAQGDVQDASSSFMYKRMTGQEVPNTEATKKQQVPFLDPTMVLGDWQDEFNVLGETIATGNILGGILSLIGIDINTGTQKFVNDKLCQALLNEYVQYGIAGGEIIFAVATLGASKGITAAVKGMLELTFHFAVGMGLDKLLGLLIEWVVKEYARLYFTGLEQGADRFNTGYVAQNSIAQNSNRNVNYGRPMDQAESNLAQQLAMETLFKENKEKPFAERYFAIDNPFSLVGLTVAKLPVSTGGFSATLKNGLHLMGSVVGSPAQLFGSVGRAILPTQTAHAERLASGSTTFGVEQWGWSAQEQQRVETDPSFSMTAQPGQDPPLLAFVEPRIQELDDRYNKCYDPNAFVIQSDSPKNGNDKICTKEFLSTDDALHWRYYKALMFAAQRLTGSIYASQ